MKIRPRKQSIALHNRISIKSAYDRLIKDNVYSLEKQGITQSILSNWTCRVKFCLACQGWATPESGKNTYFGSMCHDICENGYKKGRCLSSSEIDKVIDLFIKKNKNNLISWTGGDIEFPAAIVKTIMTKYWQFYESDFNTMNILRIEEIFGISIRGIILKGKIDLLFDYKKDPGRVCLMEHKSMGTIREDILKSRLPIDKQNLFYLCALDNMNIAVNDVLYNIIRRPQLKRTVKESIREFCNRLTEDIEQRPDFYFIRYSLCYSNKEKLEYNKQLLEKLIEINSFINGKLPMYRNEFACESSHNGAPFLCEYIDACTRDDLSGYIKKELFLELK